MMAECYDQDSSEDRYRLLHRRLATAYRPAPPPPVPPHPPDDDESHQLPAPPVVAESAAAAAQLFGGSFKFIVQEQAKSMVAIQELQQEVGSLLLFRQAVLAALPHLHQQPNNLLAKGKITAVATVVATATNNNPIAAIAATTTITGGQSWTRRKQQHLQQQQQQQLTGGGGYRSLQDGSSDQPTASAIIASSSSNNPVADSGFSTEASNSNTSPRSSRFDTTSSSEMTMSHHSGQQQQQQQQPQQHQPMEKELLQHLERVQQRLARLRKDEDRLQTLLNLKRMANGNLATTTTPSTSSGHDDGDELWHLLEEIQLRSQAIRSNDGLALKDAVNKPEETIQQQQQQQPMSHKKRVSFQQQQQQLLETEGGGVIASVDGLPSPAGKSSTVPVVGSSSTASSSGSSSSSSRYQPPSRDQVATILRLTNPVQLQRHLLRALLDNQTLREQVENGRCDAESRDAQWRNKSQVAVEQMTALRDENEDLRFQLEEQKIELEGTKARLRMLNRVPSPSIAQQHRVNGANGGPGVTSVRVRATSTQTERPSTLLLHNHPAVMSSPVLLQSVKQSQLHMSHFSQGTQTMTAAMMTGPELSPEDNNNKVVGGVGGGRALPRVVDASPKPPKLLSKLVDLAQGNGKVNGSGSSWGDPDEERPSVEGGRRSYSSRIPTPIKPTVIPVTTTLLSVTPTGPSPSSSAAVNVNNYNNNNNSSKALPSAAVGTLAAATTPSKRELPDIPVMMTTPNKMATVLHSTKSSPVTPQQLGSKLHHHHHLQQQRGSKSEPANVPATTKVRLPLGSSHKLRTRLALTDSLSSSEEQQPHLQQQLQPDNNKVDDYYDSINANSKNRGSPLLYQQVQQQQQSPVDSLERSLPSVAYHFHRRVVVNQQQQRDNRSYNSQSSAGSSTTPSNSLSYHP